MLLFVMFESRTWRVQPGETFTVGRSRTCSVTLPTHDRGISRTAGSLSFHDGAWWLRNDSTSSLLFVTGDRGFRVDLPPGMQIPVQQWHAKVRLNGVLCDYTLRLRIPDLDEVEDVPAVNEAPAPETAERLVTSTRYRARLTKTDRLVLAARFEDYLTWRHAGPAAPRTAKETAERIGWQPHTVAKRCENIRDRYSRLGVPGLRGPRALEELASLLISTGELTAEDLRLLPQMAPPGPDGASVKPRQAPTA
jgi:FHA domain